VLLAALYLVTGLGKIGAYTATAGYMTALGVPSALLPVVIATEIFGAVAIVLGWKTRITASLLAAFTLLCSQQGADASSSRDEAHLGAYYEPTSWA
jgi:putative oxidoreductase